MLYTIKGFPSCEGPKNGGLPLTLTVTLTTGQHYRAACDVQETIDKLTTTTTKLHIPSTRCYTCSLTQTYCLQEQYRDAMNAEQLSLTHYLCPYKFLNTKDFLVRSYLYLGRSNEWPLGRRLMDSCDLSRSVFHSELKTWLFSKSFPP